MPAPNPFIPTDFSLRPPPPAAARKWPALAACGCNGGASTAAAASGGAAAAAAEGGGGEEGGGGGVSGQRLRLFHRTELRFKAPKAVVYLDFQVCVPLQTAAC